MEIFRAAYGYEGLYEVSDHGNVRRIKPGKGTRYMRNFKPVHDRKGYVGVGLRKDGKTFQTSVHRLVAQTFIRPIAKGECVNHLDGNPSNNLLSNLEITTYSGNTRHAIDVLGFRPAVQWGERNGNTLLTEEQARYIRDAVLPKGGVIALAKEWGVKPCTLYSIRTGRSWRRMS